MTPLTPRMAAILYRQHYTAIRTERPRIAARIRLMYGLDPIDLLEAATYDMPTFRALQVVDFDVEWAKACRARAS